MQSEEFEQNLREFVAGKIPCELAVYCFFRDRNCTEWLHKTASNLKAVLADLYDRHKILPAAVLHLLAHEWWFCYQTREATEEGRELEKILSDPRGRLIDRSVKTLDAAIREVETWKPVMWGILNIDWTKPALTMEYHDKIDSRILIKDLTRLRDNIVQLRKKIKKKGQRPKVQARRLARNLAALFRKFSGGPRYKEIAEIFSLTWPEEWKRPKSNNADTMENLVNDGPPQLPGPNFPLNYAVALQTRDPEYAEHWRQREKVKAALKGGQEQKKAMAERRRLFEQEMKRRAKIQKKAASL
jgi:hypothetical protein